VADPPPVENRRLVDRVDAATHQVLGRRGALFVRVIPVFVAADDLQPARLEHVDVALLVLAAVPLEEQDLRILALRGLVDQARVRLQLEVREVSALQEPDQVRRGDDQLPLTPMHL